MFQTDLGALTGAWQRLIGALLSYGSKVSPRGKETKELLGVQLRFDGRKNVIVHPARDLNYRFMVAEWLWIANGRTDVGSISRFNKQIAQFSDDGFRFAGAYGPPIREQLPYVVKCLKNDDTSRQALLTIWRPSPPHSKDIPCTVALQFLLRKDKLNVVATMRSSDVWLGVPYDAFNFSQLGNAIGGALGVEVGDVIMNLGSSHIYQPNYEAGLEVAQDVVNGETVESPSLNGMPPVALTNTFLDGDGNEEWLKFVERDNPDYVRYCRALMAKGKAEALEILRG
jgi:thymidylate synthase